MSNISILSNRDDDNDRIVVNQTKPSFLTFFGKNKNKDNSDNETPPDDEKKKNESKHVSKDYEDSLEYFRKQSEIEHALRREDNNNISINKKRKDNKKRNDSDDDDNTPIITFRDSNNSNEHLNTPPPSRPKNQRNTPSPSRSENQRDTPPPSRPEDQRTTTSSPNIPLYPELRVINKSPLDDLDDLYDHSEPPPSYDALFPDPPKIVKVDEKSLPPPPIEKKTIDTDIKKKPIFTDTKKKPITGTTHKETKLAIPPIPPKVNPLIPPKVPPKIPIPTARRDIIPPQPPHNSSQQPHNNTPSNIFLQEQASLPSSVYPPPFYVNRYNNNQS
ncbi:hypothetical protein C1645_732036 [Glomus cerebriforme]|uniref:Uncharacterized protein n=1 Tax=Glomus cerebriforme TaxID=658196 RepID=A0A397TIU7_9GLOM|nr:hypothetical protein C1645_732036 [Glomus cerebriforme]